MKTQSTYPLRLPRSIKAEVERCAKQDGISINQFIATAVAEKAAALLTVEYLEERARRADPKLVDRILRRVPDVPPDPGDELPHRGRQPNKRLQPTKARSSSSRSKRSPTRLRG